MSDIVIYGKGKIGQSLAKLLQKEQKKFVVYDDENGFECDGFFENGGLVLLSPGVKPYSQGVVEAQKVGANLVSELQYCFDRCASKIISVTGTNGKTTTCQLIYHILKCARESVYLLGNGGVPFCEHVDKLTSNDVAVVESSSFMLHRCTSFAPYVSLFTSLACDHVDYHQSYENYVLAKCKNFIYQQDGYAIFNADDDNVVEVSSMCKCQKLYYSTSSTQSNCYFDGESVCVKLHNDIIKQKAEFLCSMPNHNLSNVLGAILCCSVLGVPLEKCVGYVQSFKFLPHRMQVVATIGGVTFINDSKATNVHATVNALKSLRGKQVALILGGSDKGFDFDEIFAKYASCLHVVVAVGQTATKICNCASRYSVGVKITSSINQAVQYCFEVMKNIGGIVLMSNACASFDAFVNYKQRGNCFINAVKNIQNETQKI